MSREEINLNLLDKRRLNLRLTTFLVCVCVCVFLNAFLKVQRNFSGERVLCPLR